MKKLDVNQWKDTSQVIKWFNNIPEKNNQKFIIYDIKDFYPSISRNLLQKALKFAKSLTTITDKDIEIVLHSRKSLLFHDGESWMKKNGDLFDVSMGAFDGAEICELVGIFMQHQISQNYNVTHFGLYRDDGLAVFKNITGSESERIKKHLQAMFKRYGLDIIIECNKSIVDFLDVTLNLSNGTFRPYHKPDSNIQYIHTESNHPPNIIKQIPNTVQKRLSNHSSNETIFNQEKVPYEKALKESGYKQKLTFKPSTLNANARNRKRKIIWFNPPYNKNITTKIGKRFLFLINFHFPKHHKYHKIFNRNTIKISYSCTKNIKSIIQSHNKKILSDTKQTEDRLCNCIEKNKCPLEGKCLTKELIYKATVTCDKTNNQTKTYIGLAETTFKKRFANHKKSFNIERYEKETELSKEVWSLKREGNQPTIKWKIIRVCPPFNRASMRCYLCLNEKFEIATNSEHLLNSRNEIISKCRHMNKYLLKNHDSKD